MYRIRHNWLLCYTLLVISSPVCLSDDINTSSARVQLTTTPVKLSPGESAMINVLVKVRLPYHIQANPASYDYLIPALLALQAPPSLRLDPPLYPPGVPYLLEGSDLKLSVYDGEITLTQRIYCLPSTAPGRQMLPGKFRFQACDHKQCLPPETLRFEQQVDVIGKQ